MANRNTPFEKIDLLSNPAEVSEANFLELQGTRPEISDWDTTIQRLQNAHDRFYKIQPAGTAGQGPLQAINSYFIEIVNWLQGKASTANWVAIPQVLNTQSITQDLFNQFRDSWLPNLEGTMNSDQNFINFEQIAQQVRTNLGSLSTIKVDPALEGVISKFEKQTKNIEDSFKAYVDLEKENAKKEIKVAKSLEQWADYYEKVEADYTVLIEGSHNLKVRSPVSKIPRKKGWYQFRAPISRVATDAYLRSSFDTHKAGEAKKRTVWFFLLALVIITPVLCSTLGPHILGISNPFFVEVENGLDVKNEILGKLKWLPLVVIIAFGYAFTNKNYRILSNLREQYRHRKTVSLTLQGIIAGIDENNNNRDIRVKLVEIGAKAMFDLKTIGHLTKRDSDSSPMAEIIQTILPGK